MFTLLSIVVIVVWAVFSILPKESGNQRPIPGKVDFWSK